MNGKTTLLMSCLLVLVAALPGAMAKTNYIDQGSFDADATASGVWQNINRVDQGGGVKNGGWDIAAWPGKGYSYDVALSSSNCQFTLVVDTHVFVIGAASALAVIDDEDDVHISGGAMKKIGYYPPAFLGSETSDADCNTAVGPVVIDVHTSHGWGEPAPFGAVADVLSALEGKGSKGSNGKKGPANYIDQGNFYTTADATRVAHNLNRVSQQISNGAAAAANCQAVIVVHSTLTVAALASADGTIEDSDKVEIMDADADAQMRDSTPPPPPSMEELLNNDHNATDSCSQPIESITITVKPHADKIPPRS